VDTKALKRRGPRQSVKVQRGTRREAVNCVVVSLAAHTHNANQEAMKRKEKVGGSNGPRADARTSLGVTVFSPSSKRRSR
jgi:hypothetical protein